MSYKPYDHYRRKTTRLQKWDYGWSAWYFVTIKTKNNEEYFGKIQYGKMYKTHIGNIADKYWFEIPKHFNFIELGEFIVMPDHIHGLVHINKPKNNNCNQMKVGTRHCLVPTTLNNDHSLNYGKLRFRNPGKQNLSSIIGSYKSFVSRKAHKIDSLFAWQSRFYDRIIDDIYELMEYEKYILNNPRKWNK